LANKKRKYGAKKSPDHFWIIQSYAKSGKKVKRINFWLVLDVKVGVRFVNFFLDERFSQVTKKKLLTIKETTDRL